MPYLVPAWALSTIGIRTMVLPRKMVSTACHQFMPSLIRDEASMHVGTQADMEIHSPPMSFIAHLRSARVVGAMSRLYKGEPETPSRTSSRPPAATDAAQAAAGTT